ncbi:MAG: hypothetical protein HUU22_07115 [Phycisphaerae bacterium]|nr:hypothetical protein [Phycisphaerae bacterium]NUQ45786.1 hypothetical protein [Phycisphaerae bacterium]
MSPHLLCRLPLLLAAVGLSGNIAAAQEGDAATDLKVSRVALFSSGVGYFQCDTRVTGHASAELKFRTDQINDILKSLVARDADGGTIGVVSYASQDPIEKTLRSFGVDITGRPTLGQLLDQLRGEPVEIGGPRKMNGVIVGVEKRRQALPDKQVVEFDVLNVLTETGIQQLVLSEAQGIRLTNEKVAGELRKALDTLAKSHDADKKSVRLEFNGQGERRVRVSYLLEAPIWKTSYRLVLSAEGKPFLQGWATVENATEEDWNDVRLSLVSGRPISFIMDLYTPIYIPRPKVELELYASLRPPEMEAGFEDRSAVEMLGRVAARRESAPAAPAAAMRGRRMDEKAKSLGFAGAELAEADDAAFDGMKDSGVESVATAREAGELFEYVIDTPVSVARQHSAMLPIVNEEVDGEKVSVFNPATHAKHPLNSLMLTNATALHLMQGPVTLFDGNTYAGDAKLPDLNPGEKRLVPYALDLAIEVLTKQRSVPEETVSLRIAKGTLWHRRKLVDERVYDVKNKGDKERQVIIEQAYSGDWTLVEPKQPFERTQNLLRFKLPVAARQTASQLVRLEMTAEQAVGLTNLGFEQVQFYLRAKVISAGVKTALERIIVMRTELDNLSRQRGDLERDLNESRQDQERIRQNLATLPQNSDPYARQMRKFDDMETRIEQVSQRLADIRSQENEKRKELENYLLSLNVE